MAERVTIARLGAKADGLAEMGGRPVFVPYALPGEAVTIERDGERARLVAVETPSPDRDEPFCPYFGVCGGCATQHMRHGFYQGWKRGNVIEALRRARICYDHLAGDLGVQMLDSLRTQRLVRQTKQDIELTGEGRRFMAEALQIDTATLAHPRRPVCKACLDWSERRHHLAGTLGAAMMDRFTELKWAARDATPGSRVVNFSRNGEKRFVALFGAGE